MLLAVAGGLELMKFFILLNVIFLLLQPDVCLGALALASKRGGTLRFGIASDITSLNPFQRAISINKHVGSLAFECLLTWDKDEELKPALATAWETSKDGLQYLFKLRKGVKFHDGREMTAEDVIWAMQYVQDPKNGAYGRDILLPIASVSASDPWTIRVVMKEPFVPFLAGLSSGFSAFPVVPKGSVAPGREKMVLYPSGTGPFMMTEYKPNQAIVVKKFDHYWQREIPYLDAIRFRPVEDDTVRFTALRAGDLDVVEKLTYEQVLRVKKGEIRDLELLAVEGSGYAGLIFNTESPPFNNPKLRHAVAFAIDKPGIIEGVTWGIGSVNDQKMQRGSRWFVRLLERKRDLARARALVKEAGYPNGLKVKAQISKTWPNPDLMQLVQRQLEEIDIHVELELVDSARDQEIKRTGNFAISTQGAPIYIDPDLAYFKFFHTEKGPIKLTNPARYSNPRVDSLLEQGRREADFQKRYQMYKEAVEIIHEEAPQITLGFAPAVTAYRSYVKGFEVRRLMGDLFYGVGGFGTTWLDR
jgi:peptide/nickel transport system substrate-binding protein